MSVLSVRDVRFSGIIVPKAIEKTHTEFNSFTYTFEFGKSYLLAAEDGSKGWALNWIIGGYLQAQSGDFELNGQPLPLKQRLQDVWTVRKSEIRGFLGRYLTLQQQIRHGLKTTKEPYLKSEAEIIERFRLTPARFTRLMRQFSGEGYSASCAAGLANDKKIFCFPNMQYPQYPNLLEERIESWLRNDLKLLTEYGATVLIPARITSPMVENLCDVIVPIV